MTRDEILALLGRRDAAWKARDPGALAATHTPDGVAVSPTGGVLEGRAEIERVYKLWLTAFPDVVFQPQDLVIEGDRVVQLARIVGTHAGEFFGLRPAGRHVDVEVVLLMTVRDGLVAEERRVYDFTGLLVQVGVLKAKPMTG
ncbi:MAG TPA: ester cyclase [Vicinamibacterales bacterium]|nr:ester cyclase [Vicinamibacterales bacterium]